MLFYTLIVAVILIFVLMFLFVKGGRLTYYWTVIDLGLMKVESISEIVLGFDLTAVLVEGQISILIYIATVLLFITRARSALKGKS